MKTCSISSPLTIVTTILLIMVAASFVVAETNYPPLPPVPMRTKVLPVKLSKRQVQARALREAAALLEAEEQKEAMILETEIKKTVAKVNFSTDKMSVSVKTVSFMQSGTNLVMQVVFDLMEK